MIELDLSKVSNLVFEGIDHTDYPDYSDAFVSSADYGDRPMTDEELDTLNETHRDFIYEKLIDHIF